jgi:hypothetical protein
MIRVFLEKRGIWILLTLAFLFGISMLYFRNATLDDSLYLRETMIMTEVLRQGEWIGNYAVGIHGFFFKLPVALIFFLTGPSLLIATLWNILLGCISLYLFYLILYKIFRSPLWSLAGTVLLFANFQFILNYPTYMREIPALLCLLLVLYIILHGKSRWFLGIALLLLLDAKEYVMLAISFGILAYIFFSVWSGFNLASLKKVFVETVKTFLPSFLLLVLMIFTTLVPLNMFLLSVLPVTDTGIEYQVQHFEPDTATRNLSGEGEREKRIVEIEEEESSVVVFFSTIALYFGKFLYPYSFSFLSVPKILFFPALFTSVFLISNFKKQKRYDLMSLSLIFLSYLLFFIFRASFTRYIFPVLPIVFIFLIYFLQTVVLEKRKYIFSLLATLALVVGGLYFEDDYILIKIFLNFGIFSLLTLWLFEKYRGKFWFKVLVISVISFFTFSVVMYFFYSRGQIAQYLLWGRDYEVEKVVEQFDEDENIMLNDPGWSLLPLVYRRDTDFEPEFRWQLREWVPRKEYLRNLGDSNTYKLVFRDTQRLRRQVERHDIDRIGIVVSKLEGYEFHAQEHIDEIKELDWLVLEDEISLKNKTFFVLKVVE